MLNVRPDPYYSAAFAFVNFHLGVGETDIKMESRFIEDFGADSLDCLEMLMDLEYRKKIRLNDAQALTIKTFKDLVDLFRDRGIVV